MMDSLSCDSAFNWASLFLNSGIFVLWAFFVVSLVAGGVFLLSRIVHCIFNR